MRPRIFIILAFILSFCAAGCGYTTMSLLPSNARSIYVENFVNKIPITDQTSDARMYRGYRPRLEFDITKAIVDRFLFDGNLKIVDKDKAALILSGELVDFKKEALRYDRNDNVEEYRVRLVTNIELKDARDNSLLWKEKGFSGEATYRTTGTLAKNKPGAIDDSKADLARRVVERTIEGW